MAADDGVALELGVATSDGTSGSSANCITPASAISEMMILSSRSAFPCHGTTGVGVGVSLDVMRQR